MKYPIKMKKKDLNEELTDHILMSTFSIWQTKQKRWFKTFFIFIFTETRRLLFQPAAGQALLAACWAPPMAGSRGRPWEPPSLPTAPPPPWPTRAGPEVTAAMAAAERPAPPDRARVRSVINHRAGKKKDKVTVIVFFWWFFWCSHQLKLLQ